MAYAFDHAGQAVEIVPGHGFTTPDGTQYPANWLDLATPQQKVAAGLRIIAEPDPVPEGKRLTEEILKLVRGAPVRQRKVEDVPLAEMVETKLQTARDRWQAAKNNPPLSALRKATVESVEQAIAEHERACLVRFCELAQAILTTREAKDVAALLAVDVEAGWP